MVVGQSVEGLHVGFESVWGCLEFGGCIWFGGDVVTAFSRSRLRVKKKGDKLLGH